MKKLYVSMFAIAIAAGANAQSAIGFLPARTANSAKKATEKPAPVSPERGGLSCPFAEPFDAALPGTWSTVVTNTGGAAFTWSWGAALGNPAGSMNIQYDEDLDDQNESIITPDIDLSQIATPGLYFDWFMSYYWGVDPNNNYDLKVAMSVDGGTTWTEIWTEAEAGEFETFVWQTQTLNLAAYATETAARFRFTYEGADGAEARLDNINICSLPAKDLAMTYVYHGDVVDDFIYSKVPVDQAVEVVAGFIVTNSGLDNMTNVSVNWNVDFAGASVASGTAVGPALSIAGQVDTIWVSTGYIPTEAGVVAVDGSVVATETDDVEANNSGASSFEVTDFIWAHDYEEAGYGGYGYETSTAEGAQGYQMGARYFAQADAGAIHGVNFAVTSQSTTAQSILVNVYENDPTTTAVATVVYDFASGDLTTNLANPNFITVVLDEPISIVAGTVYIATISVEAGDQAFILGNDLDDNDAGQVLYLGSDGDWFNWVGLTSSMRLNLNPSVGVAENTDLTGIRMFPNPANDVLTVRFNANESNDILINVISMDGKVVYTQSVNAFSGQFNTQIGLDGLSSGLYSVQVMSNNATYTEKVSVVK